MSGYVGRGINYGNAATDHFTGNGGATYTLNYDTTTDGVIVSLDGVVQKNGTDFNVTSGTSLVFTSVVASPIAIQVVYTGLTLALGTPADGTVTDAKITAMSASKLTGALPAISGASLTNLPVEPYRNYVVDGDFTQWPEGTGATALAGDYGAGLPALIKGYETTDGAVTGERSTDVPTYAESGWQSQYSLLLKCTGTDATIASGLHSHLRYHITGSDFSALDQQEVTISFWCKTASANSGDTFTLGLLNSALNRSYVTDFTATSSWAKVTKTITLDTSGTWLTTDADVGLDIRIGLGVGSTFHGTADAWQAGLYFGTSSTSNFVDSTSNEFYISQFQVVLGDSSPDFVGEPISKVKDQVDWYVQRYDFTVTNQAIGVGICSGTALIDLDFKFRRELRATPTITKSGTAGDFSGSDAGASAVMTSTSTFEADKLNVRFRGQQGGSTWTEGRAGKIYNTGANDTWIMADARH